VKKFILGQSKWFYALTGFMSLCAMALGIMLARTPEVKADGDSSTVYFAKVSLFDGATCNQYLGITVHVTYQWYDPGNDIHEHTEAVGYTEGTFDAIFYVPSNVKLGSTVKLLATYSGMSPYCATLGCNPIVSTLYSDLEIGSWSQGSGDYIEAGITLTGCGS
jgi:hypothetical protein